MAPRWQLLAVEAQQHRDATLAEIRPLLPPLPSDLPPDVTGIPRLLLSKDEVEITETPLAALLSALSTGKFTAVSATNAFLRRAGVAQALTNCVFEVCSSEALTRARELDEYLNKHKQPIGPLHGLPVSIKARVNWKGLKKTEGMVSNLEETSTEDAAILRLLRDLGAVPYVRTTEPQALMMLENISNLHGSTANPFNTALTPGGSSGGEGALLALHGSPLGLGSDIGGSLRSPAANCGIYSIKPSYGRVPTAGLKTFMSGHDAIPGVVGPMSPSREGLDIFMRAILGTQPWNSDPSILPIPWRDVSKDFPSTINVGVMWDDGVVEPAKSMTRALKEVVAKLESNPRFKVTEWKPYKHDKAMKILEKLYAPDGGDAFRRALAQSGEPAHELTAYRMLTGPGIQHLSFQEHWDWVKARDAYRYEYFQEWRKTQDMHVILCPPHPSPAPPIGTSKYWGYTSVFNLLEYSAAVFPVTKVDPTLDKEDAGYYARSEIDEWCHKHYDSAIQAGAPVSLQLVGRRLEEEKVLFILEEICKAAGL